MELTAKDLTPEQFKLTLDTIYNVAIETSNYKMIDTINSLIIDRYKEPASKCYNMGEMWAWLKDNEPEPINIMFGMYGNLDDEFYDSLYPYTIEEQTQGAN